MKKQPKKTQLKDESAEDQLARRLLCAFNHPIRRQIIKALVQEPASSTRISKIFGIPLGNVAYHLITILFEGCDVVKIVEENQRRGAMEKVFSIKPEVFVHAVSWPTIPEPFRSGLQGLALRDFQAAAVASLEATERLPNEANTYTYCPASVDRQGQREIGAAIKRLLATVTSVEDRCARLDPTELFNVVIGAAAFEAAPLPKEVHT